MFLLMRNHFRSNSLEKPEMGLLVSDLLREASQEKGRHGHGHPSR